MPEVTQERRKRRRREDDVTEHEIVERAIEQAPLVARLLKTGKVAVAATALGTLVGGVSAFVGIRLTGPQDEIAKVRRESEVRDSLLALRIDTNAVRISGLRRGQDSVLLEVRATRLEQELQSYTVCILARELAPHARPKGCDAAERRGGASGAR